MSESAPQRRVGKYRILKELGKGSFGVTSLAEHVGLGTRVVLKELKVGEGGDATSRARFIEEARFQAKLGAQHKGIAQVTELDEDADPPYYIVEYCDQGDLAKLVEKTGPLPASHVMRIIRQVADALSCAHRLVLHRDLKPQNLVLGSPPGTGIEPIIKLIDFGLARPIDQQQVADAMMTTAGQMLGTVLFTAPEQLRSDENLDCRCDIFSLGMTAWYLLEGASPVSGTSGQILTERLSPASYDDAVPQDLPGDFRLLLCRMLAKRPSDRPATALEVIREIDRCLTGVSQAWTPLVEMEKPEDNSQQSLEELYDVTSEMTTTIGKTLLAKVRSTGRSVHLHALEGADRAVIATLSQYAGRTRSTGCPHLPIMKMELLKGGWVVAEELLEGATDLHEVICETKALGFPTAVSLLRYLADACDAVKAAELIHFPITIKSVELCVAARRWMDVLPTGKFRLRLRSEIVALWPGRKSMSISADANGTIGATLDPNFAAGSLSVAQRFLRTAYWVLAGKEPKPAAFYSQSDCDPIRGLNEETNMLFRRHLSGASLPEDRPCSYFLAQICHAQGVAMPKAYDAEAEMAEHISFCEDVLNNLRQDVAPCAQWNKNLPVAGMATDDSVAMMSLATSLMGKVEELRNQLRDLEAQTGRSGLSMGATLPASSGNTGGRLSGLTLGTEELHSTLRQTIADAQAMAEWWRCKRAADTSQNLLASIPSTLHDIQDRFDQFKLTEGLTVLESIERQVLSLRTHGLPESDPVILPPDVAARLPQVFSDKLTELNRQRAGLAQEATKAIQSLPELLEKIQLGKKTLTITASADSERATLESDLQRAETLTHEAVESLSSSGSISTVGSPLVNRAQDAVNSARAAAKRFLKAVDHTPNQAQVTFFHSWRQQQRDFATIEAEHRLDTCEAALAGAKRDLAGRVVIVADNLRRQTDDCIRDAAIREHELATCVGEITRLKLEAKGSTAALIGRLQSLERALDDIRRKLTAIHTSASGTINTNPPTDLRVRFESVRQDTETAITRLQDDIERIRLHSGDLQSVDAFSAELSSLQDELRSTGQMVKDLGMDIPKTPHANQTSLADLIQPLAHADTYLAKGASIEAALTTLRPKSEQLVRLGGQTGQAWAQQATEARNRIETVRGELDKLLNGLRVERRRLAQSATDAVAASQMRLSNLRSDANARSAEAASLAIAAADKGHADGSIWQQIFHERDLLRSRVTTHRSELDALLASLELTSKLPSDLVLPTTDAADPIRRAFTEVDTQLNSIRRPPAPGTWKKLSIAAAIALFLGLGVLFQQPLRKLLADLNAAPAAIPMSSFVCEGGVNPDNVQFYLAQTPELISQETELKMDGATILLPPGYPIINGPSVYASAPGYEPKEIISNQQQRTIKGVNGKYIVSERIALPRIEVDLKIDTENLDSGYRELSFKWIESLKEEPKAEGLSAPRYTSRTDNATEELVTLRTGKYLVQAHPSRDETGRPVAPLTNGWNLMVTKDTKPLKCDKLPKPGTDKPISILAFANEPKPKGIQFLLRSTQATPAPDIRLDYDFTALEITLTPDQLPGRILVAQKPGYESTTILDETALKKSVIGQTSKTGKFPIPTALSLGRKKHAVTISSEKIPPFYDQITFVWQHSLENEPGANFADTATNTELSLPRPSPYPAVWKIETALPSGNYQIVLRNSSGKDKGGVVIKDYGVQFTDKGKLTSALALSESKDLAPDLTSFNLSGLFYYDYLVTADPTLAGEKYQLPGLTGGGQVVSWDKALVQINNGELTLVKKSDGVFCLTCWWLIKIYSDNAKNPRGATKAYAKGAEILRKGMGENEIKDKISREEWLRSLFDEVKEEAVGDLKKKALEVLAELQSQNLEIPAATSFPSNGFIEAGRSTTVGKCLWLSKGQLTQVNSDGGLQGKIVTYPGGPPYDFTTKKSTGGFTLEIMEGNKPGLRTRSTDLLTPAAPPK